jgi:glycosyltransferase involved in cell wall biosynthesis
VLDQTHERFELVISNGGSSDATRALLASTRIPGPERSSRWSLCRQIENWNRSVLLETGDYVKFLHRDDTLFRPASRRCSRWHGRMPISGLCSRGREIVLDEAAGADDLVWVERYGRLHSRVHALERVNDGYSLFRQMLDADLEENWIGEPSSVMVTRACLAKTGLFNSRMRR